MEKYERYEKYELHLTDRDVLVREKVRLQKEGWEFNTEDYYDLADRTRVYRLKGIRYKMKEEKKARVSMTTGGVLKELRIRKGWTLREFCLQFGLDAVRYSMIEREKLAPDFEEVHKYLSLPILVEKKNIKEKPKLSQAVLTKDVDGFGIRMFVRDMIMPEIIEAMKDKTSSLRDGLKEALGLK